MALRAVIEAGKNYCDISFMPEDFLEADDAARERGVTAIVDCGVAPGLSNILAARAVATLDECEGIDIYVGGLPKRPVPPFHYKAAFSPTDVIEEYTRPARSVEEGVLVTRDALSGLETLTLPRIGELEAFNTDGLRSLATLGVSVMREKTLRYPGHAAQMQLLRDIGLFESAALRLQSGMQVRPREVAEALLFPHWQYEDGEADLTVMRVVAEGSRNGQRLRLTWDLYDEYDPHRQASSMARTTGYVCASIARMLVRGVIDRPGVIPPEQLGFDEAVFETLMRDLSAANIDIQAQEEAVPEPRHPVDCGDPGDEHCGTPGILCRQTGNSDSQRRVFNGNRAW